MDPAAATAAARPQSVIGSACSALIATAHQVSTDVTNFVRGCRSARVDLAPVMRELSELQMVLQLLDDYDAQDGAVPDELQSHLVPIITNCATVVKRVDEVLERHGGGQGAHRWPLEGKSDMADLSKSMGVHRAVLGLVSDLVAILVSRHSRGYDESADGRADEQLQISEVLEEFRALGSSIIMSYSNATLAREQFALQIHLGQIVTYTETLVSAEIWDDAVKTLDAAQRSSSPNRSQKIRGSIPVPAPLRSRSFADKDTGSFCIPNKGLENLLPMGPPENYDVNRPGSKLFTPNRAPEPDSFPAGGDAPATGFIVMDGFINSDQDNALSSPTCLSQIRDGNYLGIPGTESRPVSRTTFGHRHSGGEQPVTTAGVPPRNSTSKGSRVTRPARPLTAGLEVVISHEKEVAPSGSKEEEITEEALAFAQVPVHILGRLSVNLVGQLYPNSRSGGSDRTSFNQSLSTVKTDGEEQEAECDDAASASTSNTGSLRDGNLQFSQIDISKVPSHSIPYQTLESQTPSGSQPVPSADSLFRSSSYAASQRTDDSTLPISSRPSQDTTSLPNSHLKPNCQLTGGPHGLSQMQSMSTMNTETFRMQKPLPRAPIVYIPGYPGPFIKKKVVVVGNFSCGKTCLITRLAKGHFPRSKNDKCGITETVKLSVDEEPMELALWDIRGIDYDPTWLHDAHVALVCFSVNIGSTDSKGKHLGRWVAEVNRNCPGAAILLVGLKADIRFHAKSVEKLRKSGKALVTPEQGEQFRENIGASRYIECSARTGEGMLEVLGETARVAMQIRSKEGSKKIRRPLSRIGKFFGLSATKENQEG